MPETLHYYLNFSASDALYEPGGPLADSTQIDALQLGPYPDYIDITYDWLRVGHDGYQVAVFQGGVWRVGLERIPQSDGVLSIAASPNALLFSDVSISARIASPSSPTPPTDADPQAPLGAYLELSTAHISRETNELLFAHCIRVPDDPTRLAPLSPLRLSAYRASHGYFIRVPADVGDDTSSPADLPSDIAALLTHARRRRADWLVLDADGPTDTDLPSFDW